MCDHQRPAGPARRNAPYQRAVRRALTAIVVTFLLAVVPAAADTTATCTTDSTTSYCEQIDSGVQSDGLMAGFGTAEVVLGACFLGLGGLWVLRRILTDAGVGT